MHSRNRRLLLSIPSLALALFFVLALLLRSTPVQAHQPGLAGSDRADQVYPDQPPSPEFTVGVVFTDPSAVSIEDLSGNHIGEGDHMGRVRCHRAVCSQKTRLLLNGTEYTYQYATRVAIDPGTHRVIVSGKGTIATGSGKERFSFVATFQDNRDGTVATTYVASRPDASFSVPRTAGKFEISGK